MWYNTSMKNTKAQVLFLLSILLSALGGLFAADLTFKVSADHADNLYVLGEPATLTVTCLEDGRVATSGVVTARLDNFGDRVISERRFDLSKVSTFQVKGELTEPGFMRLVLRSEGPAKGERTLGTELSGYEWSVGYSPHRIQKGADLPADFDAFWSEARAKLAREVPLDPRIEKIPERCTEQFDFYNISFATFGRRVYGLMSIPKDASPTKRYPVHFQVPGAGCGAWSQNVPGSDKEITVFMTVFDWAPCWNDLAKASQKYNAMRADLCKKWNAIEYSRSGIAGGRESHFYYPVILGIDRVVDWVASRPDVDLNRFQYEGTSQGGMFGLILTGLNSHFTRAVFHVPAGSDLLGFRQGNRRSGWPRLVESQPTTEAKAAAEKWAPYFDAANFATRVHIPVRFTFGFSDTICPPASVWSAYNACPSQDKGIEGGIGMTHSVTSAFYTKYGQWLRANYPREMDAATPESQGVSSRVILRWIDVCERTLKSLHGFVIVRHGKTIAEGWWKPYSADRTHMLYSHSKSFTSSAIGFLVDERKVDLDDRVLKFFPDKAPANPSENLKSLRVRDLLTMNTGARKEYRYKKGVDDDWERLFLANSFDFEPGTRFQYDSSATYMLASIVERVTGKRLMDFLGERLFGPLGIEKAWSTTSPSGTACGGWGMNMTTREIARFGQFYLQEGRWGDRQLLSPEWIRLATSRQTRSGWDGKNDFADNDGYRGYGFQFWRCRHDAYRADGWGGQYTVVVPEKDLVVSLHAALGDMGAELNSIWDVLLPALEERPLPANPTDVAALTAKCASLVLPVVKGMDEASGEQSLDGKTFSLSGEGNRYGFKDVRIMREEHGWKVFLTGVCGQQMIPVGFGEWRFGDIQLENFTSEAPGTIVGRQDVASSGAWVEPNVFRVHTYLVGGTFHLTMTFTVDEKGELTLLCDLWGMGGGKWTLKGVSVP